MATKLGTQCTYGIVFATIFVSASHAQECRPGRQLAACEQTLLLRPGVSRIFTIDRPYKTVLVGNPKVVDTRPLGERSVVLVPPPDGAGETNVIFVDEANAQITSVNVRVEPPPPPPPALRVLVHNKKLVSSYTGFRCEPTGCEYVEERTVQEPAPLPRGYSGIEPNSRPVVPTEGIQTPPTQPGQ